MIHTHTHTHTHAHTHSHIHIYIYIHIFKIVTCSGIYNAAEDYFTHMVEGGFDYHLDERGSKKGANAQVFLNQTYSTTAITSAVQGWVRAQLAARGSSAKTFAYVAHQAVHGPMEVPPRYINDECQRIVPETYPVRRMYCGMVRAVDESVRNITQTYEELGILDSTLIVLTTDNGGTNDDGGNNFPLRGQKATSFEGGVRGLSFVSGAGLTPAVRGTVQHGLMHVTDWLPTLVEGVAHIPIPDKPLGRPCPTCNRTVPPLDGVNQWPMLSRGAPSARTEVLLDLQAVTWKQCTHGGTWPCIYPGSGAIRVGRWKLLHGHQVFVHGSETANVCTKRTGMGRKPGSTYPLPVPANESNPWCSFGWTPPPKLDPTSGHDVTEPPRYPKDDPSTANCTGLPCSIGIDSGYIAGDTLLFDVVEDMYEEHNVAAQYPAVVKRLLGRLAYYNASHCGGSHCQVVPKHNGPDSLPRKGTNPALKDTPVWLPSRGNLEPAACDTDVNPNKKI